MMSPSKMTKPSAGAGAGVGISPPRHDQLGRPIPPTARPGTQAQAPGQGQSQPRSNPTSPSTGSPTRKGTSSPNANGSGFRPNNPFAQRQYQRQQAQQQSPRQGFSVVDPSHPALEGTRRPAGRASDPQVHSPSPLSSPLPLVQSPTTGSGGPGTQPLAVAPRRRLPPSESDLSSPIQAGVTPPGRRPVPALTSPEMNASGIPRLTSPSHSPRMGQGIGLGMGMGMGMPMGLPTNMAMPVPRTTVRQPSTPALLGPIRKPVADPGNANANTNANSNTNISRPRAKSTATPSQTNATQQQQRQQNPLRNQKSHNPLPTSVEREAAVPPHIRVRLRLIHRLGVVLGVEPSVIASKIDIPALLARVDAAYDKGHGGFIDLPNQDSSPSIPTSVSTTTTTPAPSGKKESGGMLGMFRKLGGVGHSNANANAGGAGKGSREEQQPLIPAGGQVPSDGPAFGVPLYEMPDNSWCTSLIGGQKHELPLVVFTVIEEIYRRGMSQPGIFRLAGDGTRISHLTKVFNMPPHYGDSLSISSEPIHNLTGLVKRYVRDMPEPILDESLFPAFMAFCLDPEEDIGSPTLSQDPSAVKPTPTTTTRPVAVRIAAAQILLRLLPPSHFSLFIYLLAFLGQLPLFPDNRLNVESISIIFGPAMVAVRGRGIAGLGPNSSNSRPSCDGNDPEKVSELVNTSQSVLGWLLRHWGMISEKVLDSISDAAAGGGMSSSGSTTFINSNLNGNGKGDPKLMAPINLKMSSVIPSDSSASLSTFAIPPPPLSDPPSISISPLGQQVQSRTPISTPKLDKSSSDSTDPSSSSGHSETTTPIPPPLSGRPDGVDGGGKGGGGRPVSPAPSTRTGGLFSRAFSSRNISAQANSSDDHVPENKVKRSTSFTSISSMVKKGSGYLSKGVSIEAARSLSAEKLTVREPPPVSPTANPQISNILGSLHDLLVSKDKQIERDARELALLRHTLLEMDEKLKKLSNSTSTRSSTSDTITNTTAKTVAAASASAPQITITSTPSALQLSQAAQSEISDLQAQLTAALASLETCRLGSRVHERKILELEAKLSRADSERGVEVGKLKVELAIEQGKVVGMMEERDEARMRLEKIKTTLFAIS